MSRLLSRIYSLPGSTDEAAVQLIGPLRELPQHNCMFRADDEEIHAQDELGAGVKRGILEAVRAFIEHGISVHELDMPCGD